MAVTLRQLNARIECDVPRYVQNCYGEIVVSTFPQPDEYLRWDDVKAILTQGLAEPLDLSERIAQARELHRNSGGSATRLGAYWEGYTQGLLFAQKFSEP